MITPHNLIQIEVGDTENIHEKMKIVLRGISVTDYVMSQLHMLRVLILVFMSIEQYQLVINTLCRAIKIF